MMSRTVAIGIDAAEFRLISEFIDEGDLPHFAQLRDTSASCRLRNVVEYRSELPWTQFLTGRTAAHNRYWSTARFDPSNYEVFEQGACHAAPFYALGEDAFVIAFDIPHSVIAPDVNGVQITGWGAHSPQYPRAANPPGLLREIDEKFGPHPAFENDYHGGWFQPDFVNTLADALIEGAHRRTDVNMWLMERFPQWDLFVTVMSETHSAGHHFWHGVAPTHPLHEAPTAKLAATRLRDVYRAIDQQIGRMLAYLPGDVSVVVFSVHGMQPNENDVPSLVLLPELLHRLQGGAMAMAPFRQRGSAAQPIIPDPDRMWASYLHEHFAESRSDRFRRAVRLGIPPGVLRAKRRVQWKLAGRVPINGQQFDAKIPPETSLTPDEIEASYHNELGWQIPVWYRHHWPQMRYFALPTFSDGKVRINLAGRERNGLVPSDGYHAALDEVEAELRACRSLRTGRPVVQDVIRMRTDDPIDPDGPDADLVVVWTEPIDGFVHPNVGRIGPFPFLRTGEHSSNGFAFVRTPGHLATDLGERSAFDITPTILELAGHDARTAFAGESFLVAGTQS
jgi:predicted AlkP superfamily phosphohydrolase/phosphomutase